MENEKKDVIPVEGRVIGETTKTIKELVPDEIIVVTQLPIITEQLKSVKAEIERYTKEVYSIECTEENLKEVKAVRAKFNKQNEQFEERRKLVKKAILKPYEDFETVYKECAAEVYRKALDYLDKKILDVETKLTLEAKNEIKAYFEECKSAVGIDFIAFENAGIKVTRSASKTKLKKAVKEFVDKVKNETEMIQSQEYASEILAEYRKCFDASKAIMTVKELHEKAEAIEKEMLERKKEEQARAEAQAKAEAYAEPSQSAIVLKPPVQQSVKKELKCHATFILKTENIEIMTDILRYAKSKGAEYEQLKSNPNT